jgi:DHA2 family multidrug resistance protein
LRNEGTALFNLMRNIGSSIGIAAVQALLVHNTQVVHATLAEHLTPMRLAAGHAGAALAPHALAAINAGVTAQAVMIAYLDDFQLMFWLSALSIPLLLLVRKPRRQGEAPHVAVE